MQPEVVHVFLELFIEGKWAFSFRQFRFPYGFQGEASFDSTWGNSRFPSHYASFQLLFALGAPSGLGCFGCDLGAFARSKGSRPGDASLEAAHATQGYGVGILGGFYRGFGFGRLAGCLKDDLEGSLIGISRTRIACF
jgi:hypothetical protein